MLETIKFRCGIGAQVKTYDDDIKIYIEDCRMDMIASGVPEHIVETKEAEEREDVLTAITLYVKAYIGNDRTDTEKYLDLYRKKIFRLTLEE